MRREGINLFLRFPRSPPVETSAVGPSCAITENNAWPALCHIMDHTRFRQEFEWIGPRLLTIPNTQHHRIRRKPLVGWSPTAARMLVDCARQIDRFVFVVHGKSDGL